MTHMARSLDKEGHFVTYAPPTFIGFRQGAYLQPSVSTQLDAPPEASRYKQAVLAFDGHISHLIRPLLDFFPGENDFDGIDFSAVIHVSTAPCFQQCHIRSRTVVDCHENGVLSVSSRKQGFAGSGCLPA